MENKLKNPSVIIIGFFFATFIMIGMPGAITSVGWPEIRDGFGLRQDSIGLLLIMSTIGHLISGGFNGQLIHLLGSGRLLGISLVTFALSLIGYWLTPTWGFMVIVGMVGGWAVGTIDATVNTIVAERYNERIMNWLHGSFGLGATLGPLLISVVVAAGSDWRGGALLFALLTFAIFGTQLILRPLAGGTDTAQEGRFQSEGGEGVPARETLGKSVVWLGILFFFVYAGIEVAIGQWTFTIFTESRGISEEAARRAVAIYWGTFTVGRFLFGVISDWMPYQRWLRLCMGGLLFSIILLLFPQWPRVSLIGLALSGLLQAPIFATLISNMPRLVSPRHAPNGIGYVVGAAGIGVAFFPWIAGILAEQISLETIPPFILGLAVILILLFEVLMRTADRAEKITGSAE